ncbi:MAG: MerR family transcriptional regulator [Actinomycetes bacterium]|jgi:DNA-binding transcriptional MerR regulator
MRDPVQRNVPPRPGGGGGDAAGSGKPAEQSGATGTMSIGEVLGILKPEFPDITVSKIRFLEGAGLVQPDRSASGYRKFSEDDVARLRFVLRAQRDQYLPLRVIRQRLTDLERAGGLDIKPGPAGSGAAGAEGSAAGSPGAVRPGAEGGLGSEASGARSSKGAGARAPEASAAGTAGTVRSSGAGAPGSSGAGAGGAGGSAAAVGQPARGTGGGFAAAPPSDAQFTRDELCRAAGANVEQLLELESFGLVSARGSGDRGAWYGGDDLVLLRLARELADYGLEARHLRMYKLFAEREAALFEQVVAPLVRQRNPEARARARDTIQSLAQLGGRMRDLALRSAVHGLADTRDPHR